jgi:hypothetical protein
MYRKNLFIVINLKKNIHLATQPFKVSNNPMEIRRHILAIYYMYKAKCREDLYVIFLI